MATRVCEAPGRSKLLGMVSSVHGRTDIRQEEHNHVISPPETAVEMCLRGHTFVVVGYCLE